MKCYLNIARRAASMSLCHCLAGTIKCCVFLLHKSQGLLSLTLFFSRSLFKSLLVCIKTYVVEGRGITLEWPTKPCTHTHNLGEAHFLFALWLHALAGCRQRHGVAVCADAGPSRTLFCAPQVFSFPGDLQLRMASIAHEDYHAFDTMSG